MYSASVRARMVRKLTGPNPISQADLARDTGVPQATLSRWVREAGSVMPVPRKKRMSALATPSGETPTTTPTPPKRPQDWTALERADVVVKASRLAPQELCEFLRSQGIHRETLKEWTTALEETLSAYAPRSPRALSDAKRIRELERDLARKDRALAETTALLILKKKMALFWGDEESDTEPKSED